ncbi:hypothetical protein TeGR_g1292, partial [Tetraparma gracilis]
YSDDERGRTALAQHRADASLNGPPARRAPAGQGKGRAALRKRARDEGGAPGKGKRRRDDGPVLQCDSATGQVARRHASAAAAGRALRPDAADAAASVRAAVNRGTRRLGFAWFSDDAQGMEALSEYTESRSPAAPGEARAGGAADADADDDLGIVLPPDMETGVTGAFAGGDAGGYAGDELVPPPEEGGGELVPPPMEHPWRGEMA